MDLTRHLKRQAKFLIGPAIGFCLSGYFAYHLIEGDRGLLAWVRLTQQIRETKQLAADIHQQRLQQEQRVSLLKSDHLDPDMLDEQARAALNLVAPGEVVILKNQEGH